MFGATFNLVTRGGQYSVIFRALKGDNLQMDNLAWNNLLFQSTKRLQNGVYDLSKMVRPNHFLSESSTFCVVRTNSILFKFHQVMVQILNPRPTKPFFVTWFTKGGGYHPLMNLKLTCPKYDCLVPWYRVGSPLSIDTKIMKIGQRVTSQWRFQTWPDSKSGFSVNIDQNWQKIHFFAKKFQISEFHPVFWI